VSLLPAMIAITAIAAKIAENTGQKIAQKVVETNKTDGTDITI